MKLRLICFKFIRKILQKLLNCKSSDMAAVAAALKHPIWVCRPKESAEIEVTYIKLFVFKSYIYYV